MIFDDFCNAVIIGGLIYAAIVGVLTSQIRLYKNWQVIPIFGSVIVLAVLFAHLLNPLAPFSGGLLLLLFVYRWGMTGSQENITHHSWGFGGSRVLISGEEDTDLQKDIKIPNKYLFTVSTILTIISSVVYMAILYVFF